MIPYVEQAWNAGFFAAEWPEEKGGGFLVSAGGAWVLVNCSDERWCNAWGKMATVNSAEEMDGLMESIRDRVETA